MEFDDMRRFTDYNLQKISKIYFDKRDFMLYYFCYFDNEELKIHDYIEINCEKITERFVSYFRKMGEYYYVYVYNGKQKLRVAKCKLKYNKIYDIQLFINSECTNNPYKIFGIDKVDYKKLRYFKEYFKFSKELEILYENVSNKKKYNKYVAMKFFLLIRKLLEESKVFKINKLKVSEPNVFIKGHNLEYDFLILKNDSINKGIYDEENILATVELKTSPKRVSNYNFQREVIEYLENQRYKNIPHIYISGYETDRFFDSRLKKLKESNIKPFVISTFKDAKTYFIDSDMDLDKILEEIIGKNG